MDGNRENKISNEYNALRTPFEDGFSMPGEFEPHAGCIMIWPERPGSWIYGAQAARSAFCNVIAAIAQSEKVYVAVSETSRASAEQMLFGSCAGDNGTWRRDGGAWRENVELFLAETDDAWARDVAPTFVAAKHGEVRAVNWEFNAWGGEVDGLYRSWEADNAFARFFAGKYGYDIYDAAPFVLEGGSIHSDGEGTVLVTEACLLSAGRNPGLSKEEIEQTLITYLGAEKILWLPRGIYMDETNEHVDNVCAFIRPGEVVLAWTPDENDPQYALSKQCFDYLEGERDAKGRKLVVHKLLIPEVPVCITQEERDGYVFEEGEDVREVGERLAASYVNFYFANDAVVMPFFGGANAKSDQRAAAQIKRLVPDRKVIGVYAKDILVGGGNIHCITQQIPAGCKGMERG